MAKLALEDFGDTDPPTAASQLLSEEALEDLRLKAFEDGYKAGWDDSAKAHAEEQRHIGTTLARNLEDLSFTYTEAQTRMLDGLKPVLDGMLEIVFPELAYAAFGPRVQETVMTLAKSHADLPVEILVAPDQVAALSDHLNTQMPMTLRIGEDPSLVTGQARIRLGEAEAELDLPAALADMRAALDAFYENLPPAQIDKEERHG